jgi:hypothetical protein
MQRFRVFLGRLPAGTPARFARLRKVAVGLALLVLAAAAWWLYLRRSAEIEREPRQLAPGRKLDRPGETGRKKPSPADGI